MVAQIKNINDCTGHLQTREYRVKIEVGSRRNVRMLRLNVRLTYRQSECRLVRLRVITVYF
jgi:hypothetical protein